MADVAQRLTALASDRLADGERVVAGTRCSPRGSTKRRAMGAGAGGLIGALVATKGDGPADHVLYGEALPHDMAMGLTDRRILIYAVSTLSGRTTKVLRDIPLSQVDDVEHDEGRFIGRRIVRFSLRFIDGSELALEAPSGAKNAQAFCQAVGAALDLGRTPLRDQRGDGQR